MNVKKGQDYAWKIKGNPQILQNILVFVQSPPNNQKHSATIFFVHEITAFSRSKVQQ